MKVLTDELAILVREYDDRVVLNYSQVDSPKYHPVADECRGLILYKDQWYNPSRTEWRVMARAFDRFYNLGAVPPELHKEQIEIVENENSIITEKIDGSLCLVHHDKMNGKWNVSTRSMAFAEGETVRGNKFSEVFERAIGGSLDERFREMHTGHTYIFELVSPETRVVHPYDKDDLYLLGIRNNETGYEQEWKSVVMFGMMFGFKTPKTYTFKSIEEILDAAKSLPELDEGYVCRLDTPNGVRRIKIKNPKYVAVAHLRSNGAVSTKRIAMLVMSKGYEEYLKYFPEDKEVFCPYITAYGKMMQMIYDLMPNLDIQDQKEFAMSVKDTPVSSIMFMIRKGAKAQEAIDRLTDDHKERILDSLK